MLTAWWKRRWTPPVAAGLCGLLVGAVGIWLWPPVRPLPSPAGQRSPLARVSSWQAQARAPQTSGIAMAGSGQIGRASAGLFANPLFSHEFSMRDWAGPDADWDLVPLAAHDDIRSRQVRLHRALFAGSFSLDVPIRRRPTQRAELGVVLWRGGQSGSPHAGYRVHLAFDQARPDSAVKDSPVAGDRIAVTIFRDGKRVAGRDLATPALLERLLVRRAGEHLLVGLNGRVLLVYRDADPIATRHVGYYRTGLEVREAEVRADGEGLMTDRFERAPAGWIPVSGHWMIAPRWECDSRWSFMVGGVYKGEPEKLAVAWHKLAYGPDVSVEFHAAIRMDWARRVRGNYYAHARDINVTLCADGQDLASGYTLTFGGRDGKLTGVLRRGRIVARAVGAQMPRTMHIHNKWFRIHAERIGRRVRLRVNGYRIKADVSFDDPEPLSGRHVAIWTYDCSLVFARVRISGQASDQLASPDNFPARRPLTFYETSPAP